MRKLIVVTVLLFAAIITVKAQVSKAQNPVNEKTRVELLNIANALINASYAKCDVATAEQLLTDDFMDIHNYSGRQGNNIRNKAQFFEIVRNGLCKSNPNNLTLEFDMQNVEARIYENSAVLTALIVFKYTNPKREIVDSPRHRITFMFVKKQKRWLIAAMHGIRIEHLGYPTASSQQFG